MIDTFVHTTLLGDPSRSAKLSAEEADWNFPYKKSCLSQESCWSAVYWKSTHMEETVRTRPFSRYILALPRQQNSFIRRYKFMLVARYKSLLYITVIILSL